MGKLRRLKEWVICNAEPDEFVLVSGIDIYELISALEYWLSANRERVIDNFEEHIGVDNMFIDQ